MNKRVMAGLMASLLVFEACPTTSWAGVLAEGSQEMTPAATIMANLENENTELVASEEEAVEAVVEDAPEAAPAPEVPAESVVEEQRPAEPVVETAVEAAPVEEAPAAEIVEAEPQAEGDFVVEFAGTSQTCATLQEAFNVAKANPSQHVTIKVAKDVTLNETARCTGSPVNITLTSANGGRYTISRGNIGAVQDGARSTYNPAMIEIDGTLRVENLVLDDAGKTAGTRYSQATTDGSYGNSDTVQDAIIATYDGGDSIVLGKGAELKNFGGMSAIRLSGGDLVMESGSKITGSKAFDTKGDGTGAAGALWIQGGNATVSDGAEITGVNGRAIYVDSGVVKVNGKISDITPNKFMWNGSETGIHVRNGANVTLGSTGVIDGAGKVASGVKINNGTSVFTMDQGSCIKNLAGDAISVNAGNLNMNGEITGLTDGKAIDMQGGATCTIGATGEIHHNHVGRTTVYFQTSKLYLYGKIHHNYSNDKSGGVEVNNNSWGEFVMYPGAEITDNYAKEHGGGVLVCRGTFTMEGGTIARNTAGMQGGGVNCRRGGSFIMKGGEIKDNCSAKEGGGVAYDYSETSYPNMYVDLQGGVISGNRMNAAFDVDAVNQTTSITNEGIGNDLAIYGGTGTVKDYLQISPAMQVDRNVSMTVDNKTVAVSDSTKLGNAGTADNNALAAKAAEWGFAKPLATLWAQNGNEIDVSVNGLNLSENKPVWVLVKNGDEITKTGATVKEGIVSFQAPGTANGCALAVVQPDNTNGALMLSADKTELKEGQAPEITYTLSFTPTQAVEAITEVNVEMITPLTAQSKTVALTKNDDGTWTGTWTGSVDFEAGKSIITSAVATLRAGEADTKPVYSDGVKTTMVPLPTYTVSFVSEGVVLSAQTVKEGDKVNKPEDPTRFGHEFVEWQSNGATHDFAQPVTGDLTINARWNPLVFTVTYQYEGTVPEGASALPEPQRVAFGETYTVAPDATAPGYTFSGWTLSGDQVMGAADVVLTGSFTANPVTPEPEPESPTPPANPGDGTGGGAPAPTPTPNPTPGAGTTTPAASAATPAAPVVPATGGAAPAAPAATVEDDATPLAEAAEETAAPEAAAETISDDGTPLARTPESRYFPYWIWVLGAALTAVYGFLVARNRKNDDANDTASA